MMIDHGAFWWIEMTKPATRPRVVARKVVLKSRTPALHPRSPQRTTPTSRNVTQADARATFPALCREVLANGVRIYVKDRANILFLTIDPRERPYETPYVDISADESKTNFSRFCVLVKLNYHFCVTTRGSNMPVYVRRHTSYTDPVDNVVEKYMAEALENAVETALANRGDADVLKALRNLHLDQANGRETIEENLKLMMRGLARIAVGLKPFEEGAIRHGVSRVPDEGA